MLAFGPFLGRMISRFGPKPVMVLGFVLITLGALGLFAFNRTNYQVAIVAIPVMVGNVAVLIAMSNIIVLSVDPKTVGVHTGMNQTFRNLGSALGPVLVTSILAAYIVPLHFPNPNPARRSSRSTTTGSRGTSSSSRSRRRSASSVGSSRSRCGTTASTRTGRATARRAARPRPNRGASRRRRPRRRPGARAPDERRVYEQPLVAPQTVHA